MRLKKNWKIYLHERRKKQLEMIFSYCPKKIFSLALELGAGDGYQSSYLLNYVGKLISTDYNIISLVNKNKNSDEIIYKFCDAENVGEMFTNIKFDLIYSSCLLEHLTELQKALEGCHKVLNNEGICIHVVPNIFWKLSHTFLYLPDRIISLIDRRLLRNNNERSEIWEMQSNPKYENRNTGLILKLGIIPEPHGAYRSNLFEIFAYRKKKWCKEFEKSGFYINNIIKGPVMSGYGFGLDFIVKILERLGFCSVYAFILSKKQKNSHYIKYFKS